MYKIAFKSIETSKYNIGTNNLPINVEKDQRSNNKLRENKWIVMDKLEKI